MPNFSDAKQVMWGSKPVREVRYGSTLVWPPPLKTWVADFETPGTHTITVPDGATHFHFWLSAGGNAGQRGDGALGKAGLGGRGGQVYMHTNRPVGGAKTGTVVIGKGGVEPNYAGEVSSLTIGSYSVTNLQHKNLFNFTRDGDTEIFLSTDPNKEALIRVPNMIGDGKIVTRDDGSIGNGPPGKYVNNAGTPGVRGGGGSGGAGGFFGAWKPGGAGGDGFCRIVFTNQKIQTP